MSAALAVETDVRPRVVGRNGAILLDQETTDLRPYLAAGQTDLGPARLGPRSEIVQTDECWWLTPSGSIVHTQTELRTGWSRPADGSAPKRWSRWSLRRMHTLSRTRYGYWLVTSRTPRGGRTTRKVASSPSGYLDIPISGDVLALAGWNDQPQLVEQIFPWISHYEDVRHGPGGHPRPAHRRTRDSWVLMLQNAGPEFTRRLAGTHTARDIAVALFGRSRVTKALVKAVANPDLPYSRLELAFAMRGLVPADWLVDYLRSHQQPPYSISRLRPVLRLLGPTVLRRLLHNSYGNQREMADTIRMVRDGNHLRIPAERYRNIRSLTDLHDVLAGGIARAVERWKVPAELVPLEGPVGDLHLRLLRTSENLLNVGTALNNCIGSYSWQAKSGASVLAVLEDSDGVPSAALELARATQQPGQTPCWTLQQLLGRFNNELPAPVRTQVVDHLRTASAGHVQVPSNYWGA